jgi:GNAT superfamily N-acetyltransferase
MEPNRTAPRLYDRRMLGHSKPDAVVAEAAAANQTEWFVRVAEAAGGVVRREDGVTWTSATEGATFAFPRLSKEQLDVLLPRFLEDAADAHEASCWSLLPTRPRELGEALLAAGFRDGWQAHWMALDLGEASGVASPRAVRVGAVHEAWAPTDLPWDGPGIAAARARMLEERPQRVWHVGAWRASRPVGHATLNVTTGELGVAGVYDMGVAAEERRRGIGAALTVTALELGRNAGCRVATLNATAEGELLYRTLGFRSVGVAQTWWR